MSEISFTNNIPAKNSVNIKQTVSKIKNRKTVIYCRVSSIGQTGPGTVSFQVQERKGLACAQMFRLKVFSIVKYVESAYKNDLATMRSLIRKYKGGNIIVYDVTRFARQVIVGRELLDLALRNNTRIFFVNEGIIWDRDNQENRDRIVYELGMAEAESQRLGRRISHSIKELQEQGYFTGGKPRYGCKVVDWKGGKKLVSDEEEQKVVEFIKLCRTKGTTVKDLNKAMRKISDDRDPIVLEGNNDNNSDNNKLIEPLSYNCIADLLNDYGVTKRGSDWNGGKVSSVHNQEYKTVLTKMESLKVVIEKNSLNDDNNNNNNNAW
jgi:DNA invertase Pin-like site-specific DNA recombinase